MSVRTRPFKVSNRRGHAVHGDVRWLGELDAPAPVVIMCHGFKGFKDWGPWPVWGRRLAEAGFVSVLFNFSHNGVSPEQPTEFTELDRFANNTYTLELDDLEAVLKAAASQQLPEAPVNSERIGLMGHSRGGGTAILQAARDERVKALVTWSAVAGFIERFSPEQIDQWETQGYTQVLNTRTGQQMRLNRVLYDDAMAHKDELDVRGAAEDVEVPWLIVHAINDESVSFTEAESLHEAHPDAELFRARGGHTFGGQHPHEEPVPDTLETVFERTLTFFEDALR